ncbi:hypothetical protein J3R74_001496 [Puniceicoccus vermicola]
MASSQAGNNHYQYRFPEPNSPTSLSYNPRRCSNFGQSIEAFMPVFHSISSIIVCIIFAFPAAPTHAEEPRVLVSVDQYDVLELENSRTVTLRLLVHFPIEFRGFSLLVDTKSENQSDLRSRFPIGSLYTASLSDSIMDSFDSNIRNRSAIKRYDENGVEPERRSLGIEIPRENFSNIQLNPFTPTIFKSDQQSPKP